MDKTSETQNAPRFGRALKLGIALACALLTAQAIAQAAAPSAADTTAAAVKIAATVCATCHGVTGVNNGTVFPRLAGQQEMYLAAQLRAFKGKTRGEKEAHDYMWGMATLLEDPVIDALATYYSQQKPGAGIPGDPVLMAQGRKLFENGDAAREIQACSACHGMTAQGVAIFPRLAGQNQPYLMHQIELIQKNLRESSIMHGVVKDLKPDEMKAVTTYLQSL